MGYLSLVTHKLWKEFHVRVSVSQRHYNWIHFGRGNGHSVMHWKHQHWYFWYVKYIAVIFLPSSGQAMLTGRRHMKPCQKWSCHAPLSKDSQMIHWFCSICEWSTTGRWHLTYNIFTLKPSVVTIVFVWMVVCVHSCHNFKILFSWKLSQTQTLALLSYVVYSWFSVD